MAELIACCRAGNDAEAMRQPPNVTMAGIVNGLRNAGQFGAGWSLALQPQQGPSA